MNPWINLILDVLMIAFVGAGLVQATRLIRQLAGLRQGRIDMERFVQEFNAAIARAEAGIKNLRQASRESGDDLEKLVEKAVLVRDELSFIVESADQIAGRLSENASQVMRPPEREAARAAEPKPAPVPSPTATKSPHEKPPNEKVTPFVRKTAELPFAAAASRAERELLQALEKLG
jgi:hypothetical protein